jgi:hypothetical protein
MTGILHWQNWRTVLAKFFLASPVGVSAGICQRALVDEQGIIRTQVESTIENGLIVLDALCDTTRNNNQ